jgi:type VI protein secretion system component Hcp
MERLQGGTTQGRSGKRFELKEEPNRIWPTLLGEHVQKGKKVEKEALSFARRHLTGSRTRFFISQFESDEHKTFTVPELQF